MQIIGVIGLGSIGQRHLDNLTQLFPAAHLYSVSASGNPQTGSFNNVSIVSLQTLLALTPDFVIVASPASLHLSHTRELLAQNIPVLIEKPLCVSATEAEQFLQLSQQYPDAIIGVAYCLRYLTSAVKIQQLLQNKTVGRIYNVMAQVGQFLPQWRPDKDYRQSVSAQAALGGGALLELSHELDYLQWLFGPLKLGYARNRHSGVLDLDVEDISDVLLHNDQGMTCYLHLDFIQQHPYRHCSIIGEQGRLDWDLVANRICLYRQHEQSVLYFEPEYDKNAMYLTMLQTFCRRITARDSSQQELLSAVQLAYLIGTIKQQSPVEYI
jgi:predicted dehydrogenase